MPELSLQDKIEQARKELQTGVYEDSNIPLLKRYYHFLDFSGGLFSGELCILEEFDRYGRKLDNVRTVTASLKSYRFVPESAAPKRLKKFYEQTSTPRAESAKRKKRTSPRTYGYAFTGKRIISS